MPDAIFDSSSPPRAAPATSHTGNTLGNVTPNFVRPGIAVRERRRSPLPGTGFYEVK